MVLNGLSAHDQLAGHLAIGQPGGDQARDGELLGGQAFRQGPSSTLARSEPAGGEFPVAAVQVRPGPEINQALPGDFTATMLAYGQTAFNQPLLVSEQFDIAGVRMLSGFTPGTLFLRLSCCIFAMRSSTASTERLSRLSRRRCSGYSS